MGTPETSAFILEYLLQSPDPVIGVVTQPDRPAGRGQKTARSPVSRIAQDRGLPVLAPEKIRRSRIPENVEELASGTHCCGRVWSNSAYGHPGACTPGLYQRALFVAAEVSRRSACRLDDP